MSCLCLSSLRPLLVAPNASRVRRFQRSISFMETCLVGRHSWSRVGVHDDGKNRCRNYDKKKREAKEYSTNLERQSGGKEWYKKMPKIGFLGTYDGKHQKSCRQVQ